MEIFFRLSLTYLLKDFISQTNFIAKWKRESILGVIVHSFSYLRSNNYSLHFYTHFLRMENFCLKIMHFSNRNSRIKCNYFLS